MAPQDCLGHCWRLACCPALGAENRAAGHCVTVYRRRGCLLPLQLVVLGVVFASLQGKTGSIAAHCCRAFLCLSRYAQIRSLASARHWLFGIHAILR